MRSGQAINSGCLQYVHFGDPASAINRTHAGDCAREQSASRISQSSPAIHEGRIVYERLLVRWVNHHIDNQKCEGCE